AWPIPDPTTRTTTTTTPPPATSSVVAPGPISAVEQSAVRSGYAVITPDANSPAPVPTVPFGIVSSGIVQSEAGTTPTPAITDGSLFADVIPTIGRNLGVALVNPGAAGNTVTLTLIDKNGNSVGAVTLP